MKDFLKAVVFAGLFAVPFLTLYVENDYFFPFITGKNFWFRIIVDVVFAAWVILALYDAKYRPKMSGVLASFGILLVIMFFANLLGKHPQSSFWSNFERMDGYVSLVHTFLYALVLGSVMQTPKQWGYLLKTSVGVATIVAIGGLAQFYNLEWLLQIYNLSGGTTRIDSTLGNAAYMAVYMLFHIFILIWLFVGSKTYQSKTLYGLLVVLFAYVMLETGTRGTLVGLAVGGGVSLVYVAIFAAGAEFRQYRRSAIGILILLVVAGGAFLSLKNTDFIQDNPNLSRYANISIDDLFIRGTIWSMAWEGVQERPLLGYGQSNFNYVFNEQYEPELYAQEQWFDRAHNIFFDWLITGGFLGLIAYLSIFGWCVWYLAIRPLVKGKSETPKFTVLERGILLGLLAGYFTHNLVVFDNIVSYIFFAIILGLIHARVGTPIKQLEKAKVDPIIINQFAVPVMGVLLVAVLYFVHIPAMRAAGDVLDALREPDLEVRLELFIEALERDSFAQQEITEQLATQAMNMTRTAQVPAATLEAYLAESEARLLQLAEDKPGDARVHVFIGSYYRSTGELEKAAQQMALARDLSPAKQPIIHQQGFVELSREDFPAAMEFFKTAFELDESNLEAREYYAASLLYVGQGDEVLALIDAEGAPTRFAASEFILSTANQFGRQDIMAELYEVRIATEPNVQQNWANDAQNWATLAFLYYELGDTQRAIETLDRTKVQLPGFEPTASCIIGNLENGQDPQAGC